MRRIIKDMMIINVFIGSLMICHAYAFFGLVEAYQFLIASLFTAWLLLYANDLMENEKADGPLKRFLIKLEKRF